MMHVLGGVAGLAAEQMAVDPEVAGFFLRQRVEDMPRAERAQDRVGIGAAGMVALAAAAIERDALSAMALDHGAHCAAISATAVSQSIASKVPSARRRSGVVSRSRWWA